MNNIPINISIEFFLKKCDIRLQNVCCPRCYSPRCYLAVNIDSSRYSSRIRSPRAAACCFIGFVLEPAARAASRRLFNLDSHPRKKKAQRASTAPGAGIGGSRSRRPRVICIIRYLITSTAGKQTTHGINATEAETMQITQKQPHTRALRSLCAVAPSLLTRLSDVFLTSGGSVRPHHYTPLIVSVLINNLQYKKRAFFDDSSRYVTGEKQCVNYSRSIRSYLCLVSTRVGGGGLGSPGRNTDIISHCRGIHLSQTLTSGNLESAISPTSASLEQTQADAGGCLWPRRCR